MENRYVGIVRKEPDSCYGVEFADFPGCVSAGDTPEEAQDNAREALALHIEGLLEDGEKLPAPSAAEDLDVGALVEGEHIYLIFVTVDPPTKTVRVNITLDEGLLHAADREAKRRGTTRSGLIQDLVRKVVGT